MIVNRRTEILESQGVGEGNEMGMSLEGFYQMRGQVTEKLASDPIKYTICETISNALDATIEGGKDLIITPIIVDISSTELKVIDKGVGISLERIKIFTSFFESTKRETNLQLGQYGLGSKAPFSVCDVFTVESNFENVKRVWTIFKDGDERKYSLDFESITTEENGTTITVPISDRRLWRDKALEVCKYFKGVWINGEDTFNSASLIEGKHFFWKKGHEESDLVIVLGTVPYTINPRDLGLRHFQLPFAVKFGLDEGLFPTISRESIQLDRTTIEKIKNRVKEALEEVLSHFKVPDFKNILDYYKWQYSLWYLLCDFSGIKVQLSRSETDAACEQFGFKVNTVCEKYQDMVPYLGNICNYVFSSLSKVSCKLYSGKFKEGGWSSTGYDHVIKDTTFGTLEKQFLKEKFKKDTLFLHKIRELEDKDISQNIQGFLSLPKEEQDVLIKRVGELYEEWWGSLEKTSDYTAEFIAWKKARSTSPTRIGRAKREKFDGQVSVKVGRCHVHNQDCVFDSYYKHLNEFKGSLCVYSTDKEELVKLWNITYLTKIQLLLVNKSELYHFENLTNMISAKNFRAGQKRNSRKIVTAFWIQSQIQKSKTLQSLMNVSVETISFELRSLTKEIKEYLKKYESRGNSKFMEGLYQEYKEGGLLDYGILSVFDKFEKLSYFYTGIDHFEKTGYYSSTFTNLPLFRELVILRKKNIINQRLLNKCKLCQKQV